jgi:putative acetyltransferase
MIVIRPEASRDADAIEQITSAAFEGKPYSDQTEHLVVNALRAAGALSVSLVAQVNDKIIGHVAFSVVTINGIDQGWHGLGPISVLPEFQRQGVGSKLIEEGLAGIRALSAKGCVLLGDPAYYNRFGFKAYQVLTYHGAPSPEYFMALPFYGDVPQGKAEFHQAFYVDPL